MAWHRHTFEASPITDLDAIVSQHEGRGPFSYCPICKCVPTEFLAKDDDPVIFEGVGGFYLDD